MTTQQFKKLCDAYGFVEIPQTGEGIYSGYVHKWSIKMYSDRPVGQKQHDVMCRHAITYFYGDIK